MNRQSFIQQLKNCFIHDEYIPKKCVITDIYNSIDKVWTVRSNENPKIIWECLSGTFKRDSIGLMSWFTIECCKTSKKIPVLLRESPEFEPGYKIIDRLNDDLPVIEIQMNFSGIKTNPFLN